MWLGILAAVLLAAGGGIVYLTYAVGKFGIVKKLSGDKASKRRIFSLGLIVAVFALTVVIFSTVNAINILLHEVLFFAFFGLVIRIIKKITGKSFKINWQGWLALGSSVIYLAVGYYLCHNVWQTNYELKTEKQIGSLRVALFADSHIGTVFDGEGFAEHMETINEQSPDIVVIAGDFVDDGTTLEDMQTACKALSKIDAKYGVWLCLGNHDPGYYKSRKFSLDEMRAELEKNGVRVLEDECQLIDNRFYLIGRKDKNTKDRKPISELMEGIDRDKYTIVLDHQPNDYENEAAAGADLVLSGHTHGGQFFPVTAVGEWIGANDRTYGYEKRDDTEFIVTSGIADWAIYFKTGTKSEYVIIDIEQVFS
ncbi:MAG: metallophosphoesterase [Ruminococcus sp.]|nr:metallophosphoesterase [Ruminococcus sp.]